MKTALITGVTGQDGCYLAKNLLDKGYKVYGAVKHTTGIQNWRLDEMGITHDIEYVDVDIVDQANVRRMIDKTKPDEVYNLAAQSFVALSFEQPEMAALIDGVGVLRVLETIYQVNPDIKFYQASTSELFGKVQEIPQNENTKFYPRSPYGVAKLYGHWASKNYREAYDMFNVNGILFNHESERRGIEFVTRKISDGVARIEHGLEDHITLGNLEAKRDWGYAPDYVEAMWLMMQQDNPNDYVIATGETHSIRDFLDIAFDTIGINDWTKYVKQDPRFMRPSEVDHLIGDPIKAKEQLNWEPKTSFDNLVRKMVVNDLELLKRK
jgi:GDPmannose 4,6-dehydratase